ncbi:MAG: hypothetical protein IH798_02040 [Gemmatimonadetes bacterium]|nr:hypothetical protein [Gemmatimonadota bacterium]
MGWAEVVTAIAAAIIAVIALGLVVYAVPLLRQASRTSAALERFLERDSRPLLENARSVVSEASQIASKLRLEIDGVIETSQDIRGRVKNAVDATEDRLLDLEALLDVLQEEMEDTVLDVAAAVRTTRRGTAVFRTMKRVFLGSGKKRKRKR